VLDQGYPNVELIVIDDGSTDDSLQIIKSINGPIQWKSGPNRGGCVARNHGLEMARADYLLFLDADDYLESGSLNAWARCAIEADADIVFGPFAYEQDQQKTLGQLPNPPVTVASVLCQWLEGWFTPPCAVLWRRSFVTFLGGWNVSASRSQDGELAVRALLHNPRIAVADSGLGVYVQHYSPNRVSKRISYSVIVSELELLTSLWEIAKARDQQNLQPSFAHAFYRIAYMAYANGLGDVGDRALSMARGLGLRGHIGSAIHRTLSSIFGLHGKLLVSGVLKGRIAVVRQK
jgi:glycosyltransferase involved in cell wall biosynthesis